MVKKELEKEIAIAKELLSEFSQDILGEQSTFSEREMIGLNKMEKAMRYYANNPCIYYDFMVTLKYRVGTLKEGKGVTTTVRKMIDKAIINGFEIPAEAIRVELAVRLVLMIKNEDGKVGKKQCDDPILNYDIFIGNSEVSFKTALKKYGLTSEDAMLLPLKCFKNNKILKFKKTTYENTL